MLGNTLSLEFRMVSLLFESLHDPSHVQGLFLTASIIHVAIEPGAAIMWRVALSASLIFGLTCWLIDALPGVPVR